MKKICFVFLLLLTLIPLGVSAQQQMIQGRVLDDKGESIIGASVSVRGTVTGGITNLDGEFSVAGKVGDMLTISYIGYTPLEVKITKLTGNVYTLKEDSELLEEVVVVGMDKQKRNTITAAVATVKSEAITSRPVTDLTSALQGNVAGLNFASDAAADYALPNGSVMEVSGNKQGYHYPGMKWQNTQFGSLTRGSVFNYYLSPSVTGAYTRQWGDHFFKGMAGFQMELQENSSEYMYKDGMLSEDIYSFDNANGTPYAAEARSHWATMGMFARLNWNYRNIYFLEFSGRYDGSSRFAPDNRWGFFPSFSAGYDISRTPYFTKLNLPVSQLKVRVSYGRLGNQNGAGLYDYLGVMTLDPNNVNAWLLPGTGNKPAKGTISLTPKMISPYITWEKVDNANIGLDLMLFDDRLSVTFDAYQRTTKDMIGPAEAIPAVSGIVPDDRAKINNATLRNRGWELSVNWQDKLKCGFSYGIGFNLFDYKAVVTKYNNPEGIIYNNHTGLARNKGYYEGMDIGEIWGFVADDLFMTNREVDDYLQSKDLSFFKADNLWQAGDLKYIDVNRDGKVDPGKGTLDDHGDLRIIGNTTPKYSFGINLKAGYEGFQVSTLFQGVG